eukprot:8262003-Alexandrium_andersonii.AAC.1
MVSTTLPARWRLRSRQVRRGGTIFTPQCRKVQASTVQHAIKAQEQLLPGSQPIGQRGEEGPGDKGKRSKRPLS